MKQRIIIRVEKTDPLKAGSFVEIYRNSVETDDSLSFDFSTMIKALSILYASQKPIISFSIS